ncbi:HU family DNA-binding protein [Luteococcus peritonei]|uniref:HU family DNA-binding protein n=1 Tax=Luteococcus peritonei TaxID=88874 RepID=A0ABW4RRU6_9ACTN
MNHSELVAAVATATDLPIETVNEVLGSTAELVGQALGRGERVQLAGLLVAEPTRRKERSGRNPRTGEPITIPERTAVRLTPAAALKRAVA